jgi:hypothetical protein
MRFLQVQKVLADVCHFFIKILLSGKFFDWEMFLEAKFLEHFSVYVGLLLRDMGGVQLIAIIDENEPFIGWFLVQKLQISLHS